MKYFVFKNKRETKKVMNYLIFTYSLPQILRRLNIFSEDGSLQIEIMNNVVSYRGVNRKKTIYIKNKNLKYFFKGLDNEKKYFINDITLLKFSNCSLLLNTYHGNLITTEDINLANNLEKQFNIKCYDNINEHSEVIKPKPERLFDDVGNLNGKIKSFGIKTGLDIRSTSTSLKLRLSNMSNDYSYLEELYEFVTGTKLLSTTPIRNRKFMMENMSIIIPVFNQDVTYTLLSIQGQNISKDDKKKLQVIIINDGSKNNVAEEIDQIKDKLDFEYEIITFNKNLGLSNARNVGFSIAKYDRVLFMDSDIVLSKNFIYDINIRLQLIPNAVFTCMRKNIERDDKILERKELLSGVNSCTNFDDSRVITKGKDYHVGCDKSYIDEELSILDDTDYFKELGFGSQIGIYNMSTVAAGHNMSINKSLIKSSTPFSSKFKGWGLEDAYFSSKLIANGCYVIPVLSSCVYHINHPPRSGSNEQKNAEAQLNYETYLDLLNQIWE